MGEEGEYGYVDTVPTTKPFTLSLAPCKKAGHVHFDERPRLGNGPN
jgi:hypothetical protein